MGDNSDVVARALRAMAEGDVEGGRALLRAEYPFTGKPAAKRRYTAEQSLRIFLRDGFVDRYTGKRLVNPAALGVLSLMAPAEFPAHPNWKMSESHLGYWELWPTVDHVIPVARGGDDAPSNWVTASMFSNSAKGTALLEEIGWTLKPPGLSAEWDGLSSWLLTFLAARPEFTSDAVVDRWYQATRRVVT